MAPGIFPGRRAYPTHLDRAALEDIGWEAATSGDANRDRFFDSTDLIDVFQSGRYETGQLAGWADGDWDDNAIFDSGDMLLALSTGTYETAPAFAVSALSDESASPHVTVFYDRKTGQLQVDSIGTALTGLQITSAQDLFVGGTALNFDGPFDIDRSDKLFLMRLDGFSDRNLGPVLPPELTMSQLAGDLLIKGAWLGGGSLEPSQISLIPEPTAVSLASVGMLFFALSRRRRGIGRPHSN